MTGMKSAQQTNSSVKNKPTRFNHTKVDKQSESLQVEKSMKCYNWKHWHTHTPQPHSTLTCPHPHVKWREQSPFSAGCLCSLTVRIQMCGFFIRLCKISWHRKQKETIWSHIGYLLPFFWKQVSGILEKNSPPQQNNSALFGTCVTVFPHWNFYRSNHCF